MADYQFDVINNEQGAAAQLVFGGDMVLDNMESLLKEMSSLNIDSSDDLKISLSNVDEYDLSFLQLFRSFLLLLKAKQLSVDIEWPKDHSLLELLRRSGFSKVFELKE